MCSRTAETAGHFQQLCHQIWLHHVQGACLAGEIKSFFAACIEWARREVLLLLACIEHSKEHARLHSLHVGLSRCLSGCIVDQSQDA